MVDNDTGMEFVLPFLGFGVKKSLKTGIKTFLKRGRLVACVKHKIRPSGSFGNGSKINGQ